MSSDKRKSLKRKVITGINVGFNVILGVIGGYWAEKLLYKRPEYISIYPMYGYIQEAFKEEGTGYYIRKPRSL
jgi:hypothetical protein